MPTRHLLSRLFRVAACSALLLALPRPAPAHEIPGDVTVRMFVKPEGTTLRVLVRVPLEAMRDYVFPETGNGYLDVDRARPLLRDAALQWIASYLAVLEDGRALPAAELVAVRASLPTDRSFGGWEDALAHVTGPPLSPGTALPWRQALLDVLFEYPIASAAAHFSLDPALAHLGVRTVTVLRFLPDEGAERAFQFAGDPGLVRLDPRWHQAALRFVALGFLHILDGVDHLLFLLCLVIPLRRLWGLVPIITSFTVAHSITLTAAATGLAPRALWFPALIETLIAASIVVMALENIFGARLDRRWMVAFGFGLVHGFGFSFALSETLQFAGSHLVTSLLSFNLGVELGQLLVLVVAVPVLDLVLRRVVPERMGVIVLSALLAHQAWHWMTARGSDLLQYRFVPPVVDAAFLAAAVRWLMLLLVTAGVVWLLRGLFRRLPDRVSVAEA